MAGVVYHAAVRYSLMSPAQTVCIRNAVMPDPASHIVERAGELSGAVVDQEPEPVAFADTHEELAGCLGGPRAGRV